MKLTVKAAQGNFFDREKVIKALGKARAKVLSKQGAFVRQRAKSSIRKRKKASAPGSPPSSHVGLLKQFLYFAFDSSNNSAIVGPARLNKPGMAPATLEYGGGATIEGRRFVSGKKYGNRTRYIKTERKINIAARPYMGPALKAEAPRFAAMWKDSVR